jgi:hypothetical protein
MKRNVSVCDTRFYFLLWEYSSLPKFATKWSWKAWRPPTDSLEIRGFVQLSAAAEKMRETSGKPISMGLACFARRN